MSVDVVAPPNDIKPQNGGGTLEVVQLMNGLTNGHNGSSHSSSKHKSSSKDKHRDKDREHKSSSSKEHKSSSGSSSRDKDRHSSSSSSKDRHRDKERSEGGSKHSSSSHSSSHRDKDKDKDREKQAKSTSSSSSSSNQHKSSSKDKDRKDGKERKEGGGSGSSSSSNRDKERSSHKSSSSSSSSRDKDRHHKSSSSSSSSSSKHKHSSSSSKNSSSSTSSTNNTTAVTSTSTSSTSQHHHQKHRLAGENGEFIKPEGPISQPPDPLAYNGDGFLNDLKSERNDHSDDTSTGFDGSLNNSSSRKNGYEEKPDIKFMPDTSNVNLSQASSCDYSMSQFKDDEPAFIAKEEASDGDDDSMFKPEYANNMEDDEEDIPLAMRRNHNAGGTTITPMGNKFPKDEDDEDIPLAKRKAKEAIFGADEDDNDDVPLIARKKMKKENKEKSKKKRVKDEMDNDYGDTHSKKKKAKKVETKAQVKQETVSPTKRGKKEKKGDEEEEVWRWWEEEKREDGVKWNTLEHKGPVFAPQYDRVPRNVRFFYDGKPLELSEETEEAATFYAKMLNHDYCTKKVFNDNFFKDFRKSMTSKERDLIKDFKKCNFEEMFKFFTAESEKRKAASKDEKLAKKQENEALVKEYGTCLIDGHKEKIGNFRLEPPGLFRGRGEHPKMGMIKRRIHAEDVSINCGKGAKIPQPPAGHRWKDVRHDNTVTWLASWVENVQGQVKYIMLNPSSKLKGEKDHIKYETARRLTKSIDKIRSTYRDEWKSKEMRVRQRAVALYFIDKLALRAGNEKDEDQADTVGCCSLRVEHVQLHKQLSGKENVVVFDFLGKDSIRYYNEVEVEKRVFKNLELFMENKKDGDDLFDRLNTQVLNEHLKELMDGLTAKVFRTYNASITLQNQLDELTDPDMTVPEKLLAYNRANRAVAILCNHQRSVPKSHEKSMENLKEKIRAKRDLVDDCEAEYNDLKKAAKRGSVRERILADKKEKQLERMKEQLQKLELQETDRDENKTIALGTSKLNYLDPRISVAWCKKNGVPIEKIFNKTQRNKFLWAIHMADENYRF